MEDNREITISFTKEELLLIQSCVSGRDICNYVPDDICENCVCNDCITTQINNKIVRAVICESKDDQ